MAGGGELGEEKEDSDWSGCLFVRPKESAVQATTFWYVKLYSLREGMKRRREPPEKYITMMSIVVVVIGLGLFAGYY